MSQTTTGAGFGTGATFSKTLAELRMNTHSCVADDVIAYGSFT